MTVVNNILNMVDLNTKKYNDNLKKMTKTTATETKKSSAAFSGLSAAWKSMIGVISAGAIGNAVVKEMKSTETAVASFIDSTGSIDKARETFEMLQQSARDTLQPFDSLRAAALDLRRNGIEPTSKQLTTFSQIAISSGKSLETVTSAFTSSVQGKFRALAQLGIVAKETGDKIALTYKGTTTVIEKSNAALTDYFTRIGDQNRGALDYLQSGMTGAINHLDNAWGDFVRSISESGLGKAIADTIREVSKVLDGITGWINRNQKSIQNFFSGWSFYVKKLGDNFEILRQDMENWLITADKVKKTSGEDDDVGILGWLKSASETIGDKYYELFNGSEEERAYKAQKERIIEMNKQRLSQYKKGTDEYFAEIERGNQRIVDLEKMYADKQTTVFGRIGRFFDLDDTALKLHRNLEQTSNELKKFKQDNENLISDTFSGGDGFSGVGGVEGGAGSSSGKRMIDNWSKYYKSILDIHRSNLTTREQLEIEFQEKMSELAAEAGNSQSATAAEIANAKLIIEQDYERQVEELRKNAYEFYIEQIGAEDIQLQQSYEKRLNDLDEYYNQRFLTDEQYVEARQALFDDYYSAQNELREQQRKNDDGSFKKEIENIQMLSDGFDSLTDAFGNLTEGMSETSSSYKALFAVEKAFAVASATAQAFAAWMKAIGTSSSWYEAIANYATAVSLTTSILTKLKSVEMHDNGGRIPAGQIGIVGEFGPEIVTGPANVTSRKATADLARSAINGGNGTNVQVNLYEDASRAGTVEQRRESDGENIIDIFVSNIRRGGQVAQTLESTYMLHRYGS